MTKNAIIGNLYLKYGRYINREEISELVEDGLAHGFTLASVYTGLRMAFSRTFNIPEVFTMEDAKAVTGYTDAELVAAIENLRAELSGLGLNPDEYFQPVQKKPI